MIIGVLKEIKKLESRVSLLPVGVENLVNAGHTVLLEAGAGEGSGYADSQYEVCGGHIMHSVEDIYGESEMILKVKEPLREEYGLIRKDQIVFTFFHFASSKELTEAMIKTECVAIANETVEAKDGSLPLLTPMSEVAGRMAVQEGAYFLEREHGGRGTLVGGVPGAAPSTVVVLGGGTVGTNAARMAAGLGAQVYILDVNLERLRYLSEVMPANVVTMMSDAHNIRRLVKDADLVINGVLIPGARAPKLITRETLKTMKKGSVVVDVAIDQGGALETSRPTDHENPTYEEEGVIHYCVTNMPGVVPVTSTVALTNATWPYVKQIADEGLGALLKNKGLGRGANIVRGKVTYERVAETHGSEYTPLDEVLKQMGVF